jgi:hypothetical protein
MRQSMFNDWWVDKLDDDPGEIIAEAGGDIFASVLEDEDEPGKFWFEVKENESGDNVLSSDSLFDSAEAARDWIKQYVSDVQMP